MRPWPAILLGLGLGCGLLLQLAGPLDRAAVGGVGAISLQPVATGLDEPVSLAHAGDGGGWLFIVERAGKIKIHDGAKVLPTPFLDISALVAAPADSERGLLGLAFHPNYLTNRYFYVFYTSKAEGNLAEGTVVIARYRTSDD